MSAVGRWRNGYGSILDIGSHRASGELSGVYSSDTGASGTYLSNGWSPVDAKDGENQPFAACVFWKPIDGAEADPSWNWVSVMAGVLFRDAPGARPCIQMLHGLVASTRLEAVMIDHPGVYAETLTFEQVAGQAQAEGHAADCAVDGPVRLPARLVLTNRDPASPYQKIGLTAQADGQTEAIVTVRGRPTAARGFCDPKPGGDPQSVALSALTGPEGRRAVALGGFIDMRKRVAVLQRFEAGAVSFKNRYTAVTLGQETFSVARGG